ncbi:MAG: TRAP transporter fused permease subunit [Chitinivibrionales bacterium]|nr:TRAP transporter fused permease subunit [Chitinivibrionales bacterium]
MTAQQATQASPREHEKQDTGIEPDPQSVRYKLFAIIAAAWALFQLALPSVLILDSIKSRAVHLAFAMLLVFISTPFTRITKGISAFLQPLNRLPVLHYLLSGIGCLAALYLMLDWEGIAMRSGSPNGRDIVVGLTVFVLLLEAARRVIGPALSIIALVFTAYAFLGPFMPPLLAFKGVSLTRFVTQISLSSEGIYGIPLGVSASIVYLFVLMGALLERAGAGRFFIDMALSVLGRFRGGPAKAAVVSSGLMGLVSGSSIANIVTTGTFTIPLMKKIGYPAKKAAATEVAASTDGQIMPPIMGAAAFIIAEYVNVAYIEVVKAAMIPAFVSYCALFYITHLEACKLGLTGLAKSEVPSFRKTLAGGFHYLIPIGMLLMELLVLRHSPELAAFRTMMTLFAVIVYQELRKSLGAKSGFAPAIRQSAVTIMQGCINGSRNMIPVALATAAAGIIVGIVNMGIGGMITQIVETLAMGNIFLLLLITAVASLVLGMGLPTTATYIVMASLTAPIIVQVGGVYGFVVPLIAAHLFCFYFGILADDTPPVGLASYAAAAIAGSRPIPTGIQGFLYDLRTAIIPFMFIFNTDLLLHEVDSVAYGLLVFVMAMAAAFAFTSAVQGWFFRSNRWYESIALLCATLLLFNPRILGHLLGRSLPTVTIGYVLGMGILIGVYLMQKAVPAQTDQPAPA